VEGNTEERILGKSVRAGREEEGVIVIIHSLSYDRSKASSKVSIPPSAI
jgi:hypothetical protein